MKKCILSSKYEKKKISKLKWKLKILERHFLKKSIKLIFNLNEPTLLHYLDYFLLQFAISIILLA